MSNRSNFYRSDAWVNFRRVLIMERRGDDGMLLCEYCRQPIVKAYDCIGHHIEELTEDNVSNPEISLNPDNVILVHHKCHNKIHERFGYGQPDKPAKRVYYVWGAPLSGKTTFVNEAAGPDDLVVDLDSIYQAISVNERYNKSQALKVNAFNVRDCLLDNIRTRTGKWVSAWVITTEALATNRARTIDKLGAEEIHIDTSEQECIERAECCGRDKSKEYIVRYFRRLTC